MSVPVQAEFIHRLWEEAGSDAVVLWDHQVDPAFLTSSETPWLCAYAKELWFGVAVMTTCVNLDYSRYDQGGRPFRLLGWDGAAWRMFVVEWQVLAHTPFANLARWEGQSTWVGREVFLPTPDLP